MTIVLEDEVLRILSDFRKLHKVLFSLDSAERFVNLCVKTQNLNYRRSSFFFDNKFNFYVLNNR